LRALVASICIAIFAALKATLLSAVCKELQLGNLEGASKKWDLFRQLQYWCQQQRNLEGEFKEWDIFR
jgi:hypothetical protein